MNTPFLALITPLSSPGYPDQGLPPGSPGSPSHPIAPTPPGFWGGMNPHPDQGLPGGSPGSPSHPIYHPGHPDHGLPAYPDQGLPPGGQGGSPSHPIHIPGVPDQGLPPGETIPPEGITPPTIPPGHEDDLVVAVKQPNSDQWTYTSYDIAPDQGLPTPKPHAPTRRTR